MLTDRLRTPGRGFLLLDMYQSALVHSRALSITKFVPQEVHLEYESTELLESQVLAADSKRPVACNLVTSPSPLLSPASKTLAPLKTWRATQSCRAKCWLSRLALMHSKPFLPRLRASLQPSARPFPQWSRPAPLKDRSIMKSDLSAKRGSLRGLKEGSAAALGGRA